MPRFQGMRHFKYGIEPIPKSQWTGNEAKALGRVYLPLIIGSGHTNFTRAARAITDFQMRARLPELTDTDLGDLKNDLRVFHAVKDIFIETEPWKATNHVDATEQMTTYLQRRETWAIAGARMYEAGLLPQSLRDRYELRSRVDYQPRSCGNLVEEENEDEADDADADKDADDREGIVISDAQAPDQDLASCPEDIYSQDPTNKH
ncbi:Zn-finger protein [Rhizoctonia solani]|uniref:Zn-finger protein n=1 Tax=Rhizoctonia solani TaxID=456999 RepID=A0A8H7M4R4_9AGAM|nr:Zn-finger protein [Rhizoctonia solani]